MAQADLIANPSTRKLRIFAFDPSVSGQFNTSGIGEITISIPWERDLEAGPIGEYIEVVDADPASGAFYRPVDLNDKRILAQNGLAPSETNPQFHQQMVYAVAMATIGHFEQALGRVALWSSHREGGTEGAFVRRLRIYPHALRDRNAFYSPVKKALLFGYFPVSIKNASNTPGTLVFTCASHDIIAHETTHALLDGVHPRFNEPFNHDVLAFHEAFADIVALFQHFAYPGVLRDQIARTRGNLAGENLLGQLAQQFGAASGRGNALRDALGAKDPATGIWAPHKADVHLLDQTHEPHDRGAILVAAVFGAFMKVYKARTADLYRIATEGTGVLREGDIHPDLANRLADEAARCAFYVLQMCIRAIDYCPPIGITFGDYLRAIVTADNDVNPEDIYGYRLAFVESFRQWGISPKGMRSMSVESLMWPTGDEAMDESGVSMDSAEMNALVAEERDAGDYQGLADTRKRGKRFRLRPWDLDSNRYKTWEGVDENSAALWAWLVKGPGRKLAPAVGIVLDDRIRDRQTIFRSPTTPGALAVEVHSVRTALRRTARGSTVSDLVVEITQRRRGYFDAAKQAAMDRATAPPRDDGDFRYRAGCTLLIDPQTMSVRRVIKTAGDIADNGELERVRRFLTGHLEPGNAFERARAVMKAREPFALLHRDGEA
ncbi:hypothetical protein [Bradyrhizobium sp. LA2.1]|uniref:hypothetical protein n=1 Tax=Bradyrhizobium sp. LA2.1 TaxID=3156376 RepID=UPI003397890F